MGILSPPREGLYYNQDNCEAIAASMQNNLPVDPDAPITEPLTTSYASPGARHCLDTHLRRQQC